MTNHDLLILLNVIRSFILVASIFGVLVYKRVAPSIAISIALILLVLNMCGLGIATLLVNRGP